jgi:hypothetical protein
MRLRKRFIQSKRTYKDSKVYENLPAERASGKMTELFDVKEEAPLVPKELHDLARHINCRAIDPDEDFVAFDYHLCRLSHARSLIDLCLGELLRAFKKVHGSIGYSKIDDFADEHLSFSGRLAHEMILNYERLQALPLLREAYINGEIVKSALRLLLRVATKESEADLLAGIDGLSVREIEELVRERLKTIKVCKDQKNKTGGDAAGSATECAADGTADGASATMITVENAAVSGLNGGTGSGESGEVGESEEAGEAGPVSLSAFRDSEEDADSALLPEEMLSEEIPSEEAGCDEGSGVVMKFNVPRTLALTWDFSLEIYRENERTKSSVYGFVEALVSGFLDSTADLVSSRKPGSSGANPASELTAQTEAEPTAQTVTLFDTETASEDGPAFSAGREVPLLYAKAFCDDFSSESALGRKGRNGSQKSSETGDEYPDPQNEERLKSIRESLSLQPFVVKLPESYSQIPSDPYALSHKIIRVAQMRQSIDYHIGWFLKAVRDRHLQCRMEFSKIEDYAKARINISSSTTFRLIKLVSYFKNHPVIEKAFLKRKITREQAFQIASLEDGRHERIWLQFAMSRPTRELRDEVNRMLRIKEFDYFAPHSYALLPGFRYITDDRYDELSDEMKDIVRTGAWYKGPGSEWPIMADDEYLLRKDLYDTVDLEMDADQLSKCAAGPGEVADPAEIDQLSKCAVDLGEVANPPESDQLSKCAAGPGEVVDPPEIDQLSKCAADSGEAADQSEINQLSKCAAGLGIVADPADANRLSKCAADPGKASDSDNSSCGCWEGHRHCSDESIEKVRSLCTLPDKNHPAMTMLLDVLDSLARLDGGGCQPSYASSSRSALDTEPTMPVRFFIPRELYGIWNAAIRRYCSLISFDDSVELLVNNEGAEHFIAILVAEYLLNEKAHQKAARNNKVFERDGYRCQVPGCSNCRNIHSHHLEFRSHGGCDAQSNRLTLCASHHLWILHLLHGLKIEGTAPDELTFTFGPNSGPEGQPFMVYSSGRKVISAAA